MVDSLRDARNALAAQNDATLALEQRLRHAQRLALVGQMAANVAHQVGSPLNVVLGRARYALRQGGQQERDARHLREIVAGADRSPASSSSSSPTPGAPRGPSSPSTSPPSPATPPASWRWSASGAGCARASTARRASSSPGAATTRAGAPRPLRQRPPGAARRRVARHHRRAVRSGRRGHRGRRRPGRPPRPTAPPHLRKPFFTTKAPAQGTGLGLAICDELLRRGGGTIRVSSSPRRRPGSPSSLRVGQRRRPPPVKPTAHAAHRILVVDDNEGLARFVEEVLADAGHAVEVAQRRHRARRGRARDLRRGGHRPAHARCVGPRPHRLGARLRPRASRRPAPSRPSAPWRPPSRPFASAPRTTSPSPCEPVRAAPRRRQGAARALARAEIARLRDAVGARSASKRSWRGAR